MKSADVDAEVIADPANQAATSLLVERPIDFLVADRDSSRKNS